MAAYIQTYFVFILVLAVFLVNLVVALIVRADARRLNLGPKLWFIFCLIGGFLGLVIYIMVRRKRPSDSAPAKPGPGSAKASTGRVSGP